MCIWYLGSSLPIVGGGVWHYGINREVCVCVCVCARVSVCGERQRHLLAKQAVVSFRISQIEL